MKIAAMMRATDQDSGFRADIEGLLGHPLCIDHAHSDPLPHRPPSVWAMLRPSLALQTGCCGLLTSPYGACLPFNARGGRSELILNPNFRIPPPSRCPVAMGRQEPA
jgi:hypothetical protein